MKREIYILLFLPLLLFSDFNIEKINSILSNMRLDNDKPLVYYSKNRDFFNKLKIKKSDSINEANIIIFPTENNIKKISIVNSFDELKKSQNSVGAIYIKKGRTQIIFVDERLKANSITLPDKFNKYIIKECYLKEFCLLKHSN